VKQQCQATKADGSPCRGSALPGKSVCLFHDPTQAGKAKAARRKGGKTRSKQAAVLPLAPDVKVEDVAGVVKLLSETISQVRRGEIDPKIANATGYLSSVLLRALEGGVLAREIEAQAEAMKALRAEVEAMRRDQHLAKTAVPHADGVGCSANGHDQEPDPRSDRGGPCGDPSGGRDDGGPVAGEVTALFG
jgi:hypothetical protein